MSLAAPDFFMASTESREYFRNVRACWRIRRVASEFRDDGLLVRINLPIIGQPFGKGAEDIDEVVLFPRHQGASLFPVSEWPLYAHLCLPERLDEALAWVAVYRTDDAARRAIGED